MAFTVECLLLRGQVAEASRLTTRFLETPATQHGWPLHASGAELEVLANELGLAHQRLRDVEALGIKQDDMRLWLEMAGLEALLWEGRAQAASERADAFWSVAPASSVAARAGKLLTLAARAAADLADVDTGVDREGLAGPLRERAEQTECFVAHPARVLGVALKSTFDGELARLLRTGEEPAWEVSRQTWASNRIPHHAAYAGWRLAECQLNAGQRKAAEDELAAAYAAAEGHVPLRAAIEGLARRARLVLPTDADADSQPSEEAGDLAPHGLTPRELDVLRLLGTGATNAEIGRRLYMSPKTASVHVSAIIRKLGVTGRVQAATVAERMGLLADEAGGDGDS